MAYDVNRPRGVEHKPKRQRPIVAQPEPPPEEPVDGA